MKAELTSNEFELFRTLLLDACGIELAERKSYLVSSRLRPLLENNGYESYLKLYQAATRPSGAALRTAIIDEMTTNETLWFRDPGPWKVLNGHFLPSVCERLSEGKASHVRIWSAACSTGQEPYSVAMSILEYLEDKAPPNVKVDAFSIVATDISPSAIFVAMAGRYDQLAATRGLDPHRTERFFEKDGPAIVLKDEVKRMVRFRNQNLAEGVDRNLSFDLVLCRNVLIYLSREVRGQIITGIEGSLKAGGALILGGAESLIDSPTNLDTKRVDSALYYEKAGARNE